MRLYNTLTRGVEPFEPRDPSRLTLYVCGPTVYDEPHIGHARSAFFFDILRRYLAHRFPATPLVFVRNVTDVDDKIIEKAKQELVASGKSQVASELNEKCREVTERYLKSYHETMDKLGIGRPTVEPKATEHIDAMLDMISKLLIDGNAYEAGGDVYFAVRKFPAYGKLSNRTLDELQAGARVEPGEHKQDPLDFALWKAAKPGEPSWPSPWGKGRPGWHIECSAMSTKYLGDQFDIHGGGVDLVFPHHENEVAQAQAAGKPFARFWVHNGLLTVKGEKMSKSLGNYTLVADALRACDGRPDVLKMFFLGTQYRSPIDYTPDTLRGAAGRLERMTTFLHRAGLTPPDAHASPAAVKQLAAFEVEFTAAMDDDLNTPKALSVLDRLTTLGYQWDQEGLKNQSAQAARSILMLSRLLGLGQDTAPVSLSPDDEALFARYKDARRRKDFQTSDKIRSEFRAKGFAIQDLAGDSVLIPAS